jgi:hypothetical protein
MTPSMALSYLRHTFTLNGYTQEEVDFLCDQVAVEIDTTISNLVATAVVEVANKGIQIGADDFIKQIRVKTTGGGTYQIHTASGQTDFTSPPFPLLPHLLKGAKTSKDGHRYKVIPVGGTKSAPTNAVDASIQIAEKAKQALQAAESKVIDKHSSPNPTKATDIFAASVSINWPSTKEKRADRVSTGTPKFRTASDKQDASTKWVLPAKPANMTGPLEEVNNALENNVSQAVLDIVKKYGG